MPSPVITTRLRPFRSHSLHPQSAVDEQHLARDERGVVGAEEAYRACDLVRLGDAAERRVASIIAFVASSGSTSVSCVFTYPGATTFARMFRRASSRASDFVKPMIPAFEAA